MPFPPGNFWKRVGQVVQVVPLQKIAGSSAPLGDQWEGVNMRKTARSLSATNDGGHVIGQDHHRAKLTDHDCWLICELRASGMPYFEIAAKFEISRTQAWYICNGLRRAHTATGQR